MQAMLITAVLSTSYFSKRDNANIDCSRQLFAQTHTFILHSLDKIRTFGEQRDMGKIAFLEVSLWYGMWGDQKGIIIRDH